MPSRQQDACARVLERAFGSQACRDPDHIESYSWDFGKLIQRTPAIVLTVHDTEQLVTALKVGAEFEMPISTRGSGHSQSGQCLSEGVCGGTSNEAVLSVASSTCRGS